MTYTLTHNSIYKSVEISFNEIPAPEIREKLKALKFRWHAAKKIWYGFADENQIRAALNACPVSDKKQVKNEWAEKARAILDYNGHVTEAYMGAAGWQGSNIIYDIKQINKEVKQMFKALYPDLKLSAVSSIYSGGQSTHLKITFNKDYLSTYEEFYRAESENFMRRDWVNLYDDDGKYITAVFLRGFYEEKGADAVADLKEKTLKREYEKLMTGGGNLNQYCINDYAILNEKGKKAAADLVKLVDSYNYDDSNSMVDYFDVNFYSSYEWEPGK